LFSLGDPEATAGILDGAGFDGTRFEDVHAPVLYGHDLDAAVAFIRGFWETSAALASLSDGEAARTVERLAETLAAQKHPHLPQLIPRSSSSRRSGSRGRRGSPPACSRWPKPPRDWTFWDSHCNQECPLAGSALASAERSLPRAQRPVLVVVSVNPLDTPASSRAAIRRWNLAGAAPWHWLMGTRAQLAPVWERLPDRRRPGPDGHRPHRGALSDRPPRRRAFRLPVPLHPSAPGP
jgi:hypothetical protein